MTALIVFPSTLSHFDLTPLCVFKWPASDPGDSAAKWSDLVTRSRTDKASSNGGIVTGCYPLHPKRSSQHSMTRLSVLKVGKPLLNSSPAPQC